MEKRGDGTRKITQWHFKNWNDAEGPKSNEDFLTFVENIRKSAKNAPILVHCRLAVIHIQLIRRNLALVLEEQASMLAWTYC